MSSKNKKKLLIVGLLLVVCLMIGVSYAYWQINRTQVDKNLVTTGCFEITSDIGTVDEKDAIKLLKTYPISDGEGKALKPFTFTLRNICDTYATYQINLETLSSTTLSLDYLKVVLNSKAAVVLSDYEEVEPTINDATSSNKLMTGGLREGQTKTFNLRIWLDENTPLEDGQNKTYEGKVSIITVPSTDETLANECFMYREYSINYDKCMAFAISDDLTQEQAELFCTDNEVYQKLSVQDYYQNDVSFLVENKIIDYNYTINYDNCINYANNKYNGLLSQDETKSYCEDKEVLKPRKMSIRDTYENDKNNNLDDQGIITLTNDGYTINYDTCVSVMTNEGLPQNQIQDYCSDREITYSTNMKMLANNSNVKDFLVNNEIITLSGDNYTIDYNNCMNSNILKSGLEELIFEGKQEVTNDEMDKICTDQDLLVVDKISLANDSSYRYNDMISNNILNYKYNSKKELKTLSAGDEYSDGTYLYKYMMEGTNSGWQDISEDGWGVILSDNTAAEVDAPLCTSINNKPIVSTSYMFYGSRNLTRIDTTSFNTSNVVRMNSMFQSAGFESSLFEVTGLDNLDTSNVEDMSNMFLDTGYNAITFDLGDISSWDTSGVTNMSGMFDNSGYNATTWVIGDLSSWDTSKVTNMSYMFSKAGYSDETFNIGDLSSWDVSNVEDMSEMFYKAGYNATNFDIGDLSRWDTSSVTTTESTFCNSGKNATYNSVRPAPSWIKEDDVCYGLDT